MKRKLSVLTLCLLFAVGTFAQNYVTKTITPQNNVLVVNGINQISIPNYDPSEVQLEPMSGKVAIPSSDQAYTLAEFASLDAIWTAFNNNSIIWTNNMATLDTYSGEGINNGYAALWFSGSPITLGYAKFDKNASGGWTEFGYFTDDDAIIESDITISVSPNPTCDVLNINNVEEAQISIYTINGQEVKRIEKANAQEIINISDLAAGTYIVRCTFGNRVNMVKFVKE
ncbi:MAG: T9SS type A sorting domain-containing protein [Bacteroidales bacterium]|nr:T9SS type A sorting domain-containing protein [Bacteroidales bacterium]